MQLNYESHGVRGTREVSAAGMQNKGPFMPAEWDQKDAIEEVPNELGLGGLFQ